MNKIAAYVRIAACCSMVLLAVEARAQLEGTLFTQPDEREYLDYLRQEFLRTNAAEDFNIEDVAIPEIPEEVVVQEASGPVEYNFGGVMARRDGVRVWLNGQLLGESELPEGFSIVAAGRSFSLRIVHEGQTFVLLPGQTVDVTAGRVVESFQQPPPPPRQPPRLHLRSPSMRRHRKVRRPRQLRKRCRKRREKAQLPAKP